MILPMWKLYIVGPVGDGKAIQDAAERLRDAGYSVVTPTADFRTDISNLAACDGAVRLSKWHLARHFGIERRIAEALGMRVTDPGEWIDDVASYQASE